MKKLIFILLASIIFFPKVFFAATLESRNETTNAAASDILYILRPGSPSTEFKIQKSNLYKAGTDYEVPVTFAQSLARTLNTVILSGDDPDPGTNKLYGTDGEGIKGWYNQNIQVAAGAGGYVGYYQATGTVLSPLSAIWSDGTHLGFGTSTPDTNFLADFAGAVHFGGSGGVTVETGGAFRTGTTTGNTGLLQAYNTGSISYTTFGTLTAGSSPTFDLASGVTIATVPIVGTTVAQTLTNKTLTLPIISTISNSGTVTIPTGTDTLANLAGTQTFTNKTLTSPKIGTSMLATDGTILFTYSTPGSAVNYLAYANGATGTNPSYTVTGDANRGVTFTMAGTGGFTVVSSNTGPSTIKRGLTVNNDGNSGAGDDFLVKTANSATAFQVDASADKVNIAVVENLLPVASPPATPVSGDLYVDSTASPDELCFYDSAGWQGISSGTDANCA